MDFLIHLNGDSTRPLRDQIYDGLRLAILDGEIAEGTRLPSSRTLATNLGVSRFTVTDAYNRLLSEGYVAWLGHLRRADRAGRPADSRDHAGA